MLDTALRIVLFKSDEMEIGGKKVIKTEKTKFRKNKDSREFGNAQKQKHHDKSFYRLMKQEKDDYVL